MAMVTAMVDTTVDTTVDIIPATPTMDTVVEVTMVATMETIIPDKTTVMARWIADIPTDIHIDPKRPWEVPKDPLLVIPGTEAVPPHQRKQQLLHALHAPTQV